MQADSITQTVQTPWLDGFLHSYGNRPSTYEAGQKLRRLRDHFGIDLKTVDWPTLQERMEGFKQELSPGAFRSYRSIIKLALRFLNRQDLVNQLTDHARIRNAVPLADQIATLPEWVKPWLQSKLALKLSPWTIDRYIRDLRYFGLDLNLQTASLLDIKQRLGERSGPSRSSMRRITVTVKQVLRFLDREWDAKAIALPKHGESRIVVYTKEDIDKTLHACRTLRDRLMIEILAETGCRRGELHSLKIKDIQFDQYTPIVWLRGKTGTRTRRLYSSKHDLMVYLEQHPRRDDPEAAFWINRDGLPLAYQGVYKIISRIGRRALNRTIFPHAFRHTCATQDVKKFTDQEMLVRYGWRTADMVQVYSHLSQKDVDQKDLLIHGMILQERPGEQEPIEMRKCPACGADNGPLALYCQNCSKPLPGTDRARVPELEGQLKAYKELVERLLKGNTRSICAVEESHQG
jgi:integrase